MYLIISVLFILPFLGMMNVNKDHFTVDELKEALKKFKSSDDDVKQQEVCFFKCGSVGICSSRMMIGALGVYC